MNDLISRQAVIDIIYAEIDRAESWAEHETQINILHKTEEIPTAYDQDKVVEQLENLPIFSMWNHNSNNINRQEAIEIVKAGGLNE